MTEDILKKIEELDNRRAELLFNLCENNQLWIPEVILGMVHEIRSITKIIKILKGNKKHGF